MKASLIVLFIVLISANWTIAQSDLSVTQIHDEDLVSMLNSIEKVSEKKNSKIWIRVFTVANEPGSAGFENGEITHDILITVSEYGEAPLQKLYRIKDLYNPEVAEYFEFDNSTIMILKFGGVDERIEKEVVITLDSVTLE